MMMCIDKMEGTGKMIYIWRNTTLVIAWMYHRIYFYAVYFNNAETRICLFTFLMV